MRMVDLAVRDILETICTYAVPAGVFALLMGCVIWNVSRKGIGETVFLYLEQLRQQQNLKYKFLFFMYTYFVVDRTLLSRPFGWTNGMQDVLGGWWVTDPESGEISLEAIENFVFFVPYLLLFWLAFPYKHEAKKILQKGIFIAFLTSLCIEILQVIFKVGEFQLSDLFYNTTGGGLGCGLFLLLDWIQRNRVMKSEKDGNGGEDVPSLNNKLCQGRK